MIFRGLGFSGKNYLMDLYGTATAGYSLRRLRRNYRGPAITVRRSSDNAIKHIYFKGENLDTTSLLNFVGTSGSDDGFVTVWYDQSPSGNNASQVTQAFQPKIVSAGALVTENGKAALDFGVVGTRFSFIPSPDPSNVFLVADNRSDTSYSYLFTSSIFSYCLAAVSGQASTIINQLGSGNPVVYDIYTNGQEFTGSTRDDLYQETNGHSLIYINITDDFPDFQIGYYGDTLPSASFSGVFQELIIYNSDKSALRTAIEGNINGHYNIYTP